MLKLIEPFDLIKVIPNYFQTDPRCPTILPASPHFYFCNFLQIAGFQSFDSRADNMQISFARNCFCFLDLEHIEVGAPDALNGNENCLNCTEPKLAHTLKGALHSVQCSSDGN